MRINTNQLYNLKFYNLECYIFLFCKHYVISDH